MTEIIVTGITTANTTATEVTVTGHPSIASITKGTIVVAAEDAANTALAVVTDTPDANLEIQRTAYNKFKLYLTTGALAPDVLVLECVIEDGFVRT